MEFELFLIFGDVGVYIYQALKEIIKEEKDEMHQQLLGRTHLIRRTLQSVSIDGSWKIKCVKIPPTPIWLWYIKNKNYST